MAADFFARLTAVERFAALADPEAYTPAPDDWAVVLTDVVGSTEAVRAGRYRDVNYVGAASIAAVLNASHRADLPFVFGGDGATLLVPPEHLPASLRALAALQEHASARLGLPLRVGAVPVTAIRQAGHDVAVARLQVTDRYAQALFQGRGVEWAERQVKSPATAELYANRAEPPEGADPYAGLECRWEDVQSPRGETVSLLVEAVGGDTGATYREVLGTIEALYGRGDAARPVTLDRLRLSARPSKLSPEARLRHPGARLRYQAKMWALNLLGRTLIGLGARTQETDWEEYPKRVLASTDYRKFDGVLRMVLAGGAADRGRLEATLDRLHRAGRLAYGLHVTDRAVLTCIVYERMGGQVHFVDGAGGGYTNAAVAFKRRRNALAGGAR
ncbi:DUF3095 domain-containing protein [Rubrivirga sp. S365]|uniref:DUF3095 domain-containing protein n=1 Tax=Rubrivirga litoralis TaxID=3075598 RepID=A0ABU3BV30_9BACT|nr:MULTISPECIES: DUF3095 domain-containing protein [unclassified Rubrivirga]MDT0633147.1 DUF3095 domain-containing protein [Rubrivirga sp. F394]MDT7855136.1 DUF3095 domain-containing protein [Rubrivirga sp. S365]